MADQSLHSIWKAARTPAYTAPPRDEVDSAIELIVDELRSRDPVKLGARWKSIGFSRSEVTIDQQPFTIVQESDDRREGRAFLVFTRADGRLVLQTPHSRTDLHTGRITLNMMQEGGFTAGIWNLAPRRFEVDGEKRTADMGKLTSSYFVAFSIAVSEVHAGASHLQMHGFSTSKRKTSSASTAGLIVSSGTKDTKDRAYDFAVCLEKYYPGDVRLYPANVTELGGTKNISGATLRESGAHGFLHLELAKPIRDQLKTDRKARSILTGCLKSL